MTLVQRFQQAAAARKRRAMVAELQSTYTASNLLHGRANALELAIKKHDEDNAPDWSPAVEYKGGELVRMPGGQVARIGALHLQQVGRARRRVDGEPVRVARTLNEAFGPGAALTPYERKVGTWLARTLVAAGSVVGAAVLVLVDFWPRVAALLELAK